MEIINMIIGGTIQELMLRRRTFIPTVLLIIAVGLVLFVLQSDK